MSFPKTRVAFGAAAVLAMALIGIAQAGLPRNGAPGTMIVAGRVFESPILVATDVDVMVGAASIRRLLTPPAQHPEPRKEVPSEWLARERIIKRMFSRFGRLTASRDAATARSVIRSETAQLDGVARATVQGSSVVITWSNGDLEEVLLDDRGQRAVPDSTLDRFQRDLDDYRRVLSRGGVVALGANYIVVATREQADMLRASLNSVLRSDLDRESAVAELERRSGSRGFAVDFVQINRR